MLTWFFLKFHSHLHVDVLLHVDAHALPISLKMILCMNVLIVISILFLYFVDMT